jgi:hypothetical protein
MELGVRAGGGIQIDRAHRDWACGTCYRAVSAYESEARDLFVSYLPCYHVIHRVSDRIFLKCTAVFQPD